MNVEPVERFRPTSGRAVGYLSLAVVVGLTGFVALNEQTLTGVRIALGLVFFGVLVWMTQLRPRATAYPDRLHLQNSFRDTHVPLVLIDTVTVRRTLNVWVGDERYVCIGIGKSLRKIVKAKGRGPASLLGLDRIEDYTERSTPLRPDQSAMSYDTFVVTRIEGLVDEAKRQSRGTTDQQPRHVLAWPEIAALAVTGVAFVVSLFL